jgi:hypothetical protein
MRLPTISKKAGLITGVIVLGLVGGVSAEMVNKPKAGADTSPIVTEIDNHEDRLKNHEARISNLETDTRTLQTNTNTQPSPNKVDPPVVRDVTPNSSPTSASTTTTTSDTPAVVVTSYREIVIDADTSDCEYTYSDGTTYQFHWKTTNPHGAWVTDGNGNNGHWQASVNKSGYCDSKALGLPKAN